MEKLERATINVLTDFDTPQFAALEDLRLKMVNNWEETNPKKDTQFETLWTLAYRQGKRDGIREFLQKINNPLN